MNCKFCGSEFEQKNGSLYCNYECSYSAQKARSYEKRKLKSKHDISWKKEKLCFVCESSFIPKNQIQKNCSQECSKKSIDFEYVSNNLEKYQDVQNQYIRNLKKRIFIFNRDNFCCKYCGRSPIKEDGVLLHIDHKIPKNLGGSNELENLITSCSECNLGKSDILLDMWKNMKNLYKNNQKEI